MDSVCFRALLLKRKRGKNSASGWPTTTFWDHACMQLDVCIGWFGLICMQEEGDADIIVFRCPCQEGPAARSQ